MQAAQKNVGVLKTSRPIPPWAEKRIVNDTKLLLVAYAHSAFRLKMLNYAFQ